MKTFSTVAVFAALVFTGLAASHVFAQAGHAGHHRGHAPSAAEVEAPASGLSEGTVRRVNADAGTVTIAHGPLGNLDMPSMTMSFRVSGEASLDGLANGDKVRFAADKDGEEFIVTEIEKVVD